MSESIVIPETVTEKKEKYALLLPQIVALTEGENDIIANVANIVAALKDGMQFFWVGIYFVKPHHKNPSENELVLGPFQGPVACTRIGFGKGVCGASWKREEAVIVKDVEQFPGHIACNSASKSEIVLPFFKNKKVAGVLDVDSDRLADFDETDQFYLQKVTALIEALI